MPAVVARFDQNLRAVGDEGDGPGIGVNKTADGPVDAGDLGQPAAGSVHPVEIAVGRLERRVVDLRGGQ